MTNLRLPAALLIVLLTASACVSLPGIEPDSPAPADAGATPGEVIKVGLVQPHTLDPADGNVIGYSHPGLDYYFEYEVASYGGGAGDGLATQEEQLVAVGQMEDWVCTLMPLIPVASMQSHWLVHADRLGSAREFTLDIRGEPALRELWVRELPEAEASEPPAED